MLKNKLKIENWLKKYNVDNYELIEDEKYGYIVNVNEKVDLSQKKLKSIDVKFNIVNGFFDCGNNQLESLLGCPEKVNGSFICSYNLLTSLEYCTKIFRGHFSCNNNRLESLKGCPKIVSGSFDCSENNLTSLIDCPEIVQNYFYSYRNKLKINGLLNLYLVELKSNCIFLEKNKELSKLQNINDFNELKKVLTIYKEKADLMNVVEFTDKSVENLNNFINKDNNLTIKKINKI